MLRQAQERIDRGVDPKDVTTESGEEMLGVSDWFEARVEALSKRKPELLRKALGALLGDDQTFALGNADDQFKALDAKVGAEVDFLLTGHTHLARALRRRHAGTYYFNSGTWVRLMQLSPAALATEAGFRGVYDALEGSGTLDALDGKKGPDGQPLVFTRPCVVRIANEGKRTVGELLVARPGGKLETIEGGRFPEV
ncbi:MAG: hypothetical protein HC897_15570 [Thermoanaerobaculia bacterium]|nr:hypothetical protein [Thermoanaerobaculia bacterium]